MNSQHPFQWLTEVAQRRAFLALLVLTAILMVAMAYLDRPLQTAVAPWGIVSFELAGNPTQAQQILQSWDHEQKTYAGLSLGLDYLYLVSYSSTISLGCVLVARRLAIRAARLSLLGVILSWTQPAAALLDAAENYALIRILFGAQEEIWPALAWWCAVPKFAFVAAGIAYLLIGGVLVLASGNGVRV